MAPLTIAVAQPLVVGGDVEGNVERHAALVERSGARVVVFPELSLTGYHFDAEPVAPGAEVLGPLVDACERTGAIALVGAPTVTDGERHISMLSVSDGDITIAYRKMFLGDAETTHFVPGRKPCSIDVDGWRLGLAICKDTGEARHADATAAEGCDVYVGGVLEHRSDADVQPRRAVAVAQRHGVWVALASFAGSTGEGFDAAAGGSGVWSPSGNRVADAGSEPGALVAHTITRPGAPASSSVRAGGSSR